MIQMKVSKEQRSVIYYHQSLPLFRFKFNWFGRGAKENFFYYYIYPLYVKSFLKKNTFVAVQTEDIRQRFSKRYGFPADRIGVYFPEVEKVDAASVEDYHYETDTYNFIYPSMGASYKEHVTLVYALKRIYDRNPAIANKIRIHFTLQADDNKDLYEHICQYQQQRNFVFHGNIPHQQVLSMMKSGNGLLFPSVIETLGLPLLEAASLGIPVIANDMGFAREVLSGYEGVSYVMVHEYDAWAAQMVSCCEKKERYSLYTHLSDDSWGRLIRQIEGPDDHRGKTICVVATASAKRGALAIYKQLVKALQQDGNGNEWHIFIDVDMPMPEMHHVHYHICHTKGFGRIWFDLRGFKQATKRLGITPDVIFSLQNTGVIC